MSNPQFESKPITNPYTPGAQFTPVVGPQPVLADHGSRLLAVIIDGVLWGAPFFFLLLSVGVAFLPLIWGDQRGMPLALASSGVALLCIIALPILIVVQLYMMAKYSATIGKKVMGIKVIHYSSGINCSLGRYFWARGFLSWLLNFFSGGLYFFLDTAFIFSESRRCLHDLIADTLVVKA